MPPSEQELLDRLAAAHGITADYHDNWGTRHATSPETKRAILEAMGVPVATLDDLRRAAAALDATRWLVVCEPVLVVGVGRTTSAWQVRLPADRGQDPSVRIAWEVYDESGAACVAHQAGPGLQATAEGLVEGQRYAEFELPLPAGLPVGHYTVKVRGQSAARVTHGSFWLIITPTCCYVPDTLLRGGRVWGLSLQLYALRSARNWGVGDFTDLADMVRWARRDFGIDVIGLNPLHALKNRHPYHISPYSPDSRLYLNPLYLDVERVPEFHESPAARQAVGDPDFRSKLEQLRNAEMVDYDAVWALKRAVLVLVFETFLDRHFQGADRVTPARTDRGKAFQRYLDAEGAPLTDFATFQALSDRHLEADPPIWVWWQWPENLRNPRSAEVLAFQTSRRREILYYQYLQWQAEEQLAEVAAIAQEAGMSVGLYLDLAVGSERAGADAWMFAEQLALGAEAGAPPDAFSPEGQNWGLPPIDPHRLRADGYRMFVRLLRKVLRHAGALRIDHVMALFRLFWVPQGLPAAAGAYVTYPVEDLLGILALESVRHRAIVIGEDLGTVPDYVRERLAAARVLSYRVLYFEREPDSSFKPSTAFPAQAVAVVNTADLPTLAGFWTGRDLKVRQHLGLMADERAGREAMDQRRRDKMSLLAALSKEQLSPMKLRARGEADTPLTPELSLAVHTFLARTPSWIVMASLEDVLGEEEQTNLPGTLQDHPNWTRKRGPLLAELRRDVRLQRLAALMQVQRPAG